MFKGEIAAYAAEGVVVPNLVFKDNKPILDFIEGKGDGIYSILDEQVLGMLRGRQTNSLNSVRVVYERNDGVELGFKSLFQLRRHGVEVTVESVRWEWSV